MKKYIIAFAGIMAGHLGWAQDSVQKTFWDDPVNDPRTPLFVTMGFVVIVLLLVLLVAIVMLRAFNIIVEQTERANAAAKGVVYKPRQRFWSRMSHKLNASVPIEQEADIDMGHSFDGIRELDNHLPPWWKWLFYGTIGWSAVYLFVFHISSSLPLMGEEYDQEVALAEQQRARFMAAQPEATIDVEKLEFANDAAIIEKGKAVFANTNCGSCHRADGGGNSIGPNLTDDYWLHGGNVKDVFHTVTNGVVEKGMPAWGKALSPTEVRDVAFFILSLQGSNPPNAKAPQGEKYVKQEAGGEKPTVPVAQDSVVAAVR